MTSNDPIPEARETGTSAARRSPLALLARRLVFYNWGPAIPFPRGRETDAADVWLTAADGLRLHATWTACPEEIPPAFGDSDARPVVLFLHGNAGTVRRWRFIPARWQDAVGADVLLLDYRGYGRSEGRPTESGLQLDTRAAYDWLIDERGIEPSRLIIAGQSLGGAPAARLAASVPHRALVLESAFTRVSAVARRLLLGLPIDRLMAERLTTIEDLDGYDRPCVISHGVSDRLIPVSHARELYETVSGRKELLLIPGMGHHDRRAADYVAALRRFFSDDSESNGAA